MKLCDEDVDCKLQRTAQQQKIAKLSAEHKVKTECSIPLCVDLA
jgi:hypothetical protein